MRYKGVTLLELVLVLTLFSIIVSISYYAFRVLLGQYHLAYREIQITTQVTQPLRQLETDIDAAAVICLDMDQRMHLFSDSAERVYRFSGHSLLLEREEGGADTLFAQIVSRQLEFEGRGPCENSQLVNSIDLTVMQDSSLFFIRVQKKYAPALWINAYDHE